MGFLLGMLLLMWKGENGKNFENTNEPRAKSKTHNAILLSREEKIFASPFEVVPITCDPICDGEGDCGWGIIGRCLRYGSRLFGVEVLIWS